MARIKTFHTDSARFAPPHRLLSGWFLKTAGALALGAVLCSGSTSWVRADADPLASTTSATGTACAGAADDAGTCAEGAVNSVVFTAAPLPAGAITGADSTAPPTPQSESSPRSTSITIPLPGGSSSPATSSSPAAKATGNADVQSQSTTAPAGGGLTPALAASLVAALLGIPNTAAPAPVAKAVPAPVQASTATAPSIVRVQGQTVSSLPAAKMGSDIKATVSCPTGKVLVSGGATVVTNDGKHDDHALLSQSAATTTTTWTAVGVVTDGDLPSGETLDVTAIALCS